MGRWILRNRRHYFFGVIEIKFQLKFDSIPAASTVAVDGQIWHQKESVDDFLWFINLLGYSEVVEQLPLTIEIFIKKCEIKNIEKYF